MIGEEVARHATARRAVIVLVAFATFAVFLLTNILRLDLFLYDYYRQKAYDQITTTAPLRAERGNIYDSNMNLLAASKTVWRVFISSKDLKNATKKDGKDYAELIASGLSEILGKDKDALYNKIKGASQLDLTLEKGVEEEEYRKILDFISATGLESLLLLEASTTRYYPAGTMAAHVLGFVGDDNQGLYGLEYQYDKLLSGTDGYYVYAKDAGGATLDTEYSDYFPATDGSSIVTTIDSFIQSELEAVIEAARVNHGVENRVTGVVMDTATGAILAMATTSPFDPNEPFVLDELSEAKLKASGFAEGSEEYKRLKNELLTVMWSNKAISETYEPGSTFKIVTVSAALDLGVASATDTFSCCGYTTVGGWRIRCHKRTGHGTGFTLAYGLQMSCNPCMIALSERIGSKNFFSYVERFGYLEKTGIDLPGEATTIFHTEEGLGATELATSSFGQRFKVSVINQLTAIAAVANGGRLVTPYLVERVIDADGNTVSDHEAEVRRQVIDEDVAKLVSEILIEGVSGDGGAKNAGVAGYDIAAKTGTSQKFDILDENGSSYLRIGSTVAYATSGESGIATIIVVDEPTSEVKYGSTVAAPYVSELLESILPYLEFKSNDETVNRAVEDYVGMNVNSAKSRLDELKISYEVVGGGDVVIGQTPSGGESFSYPISRVILYTEERSESVTVPSLVGMTLGEAIAMATNAGLNLKLVGMSAGLPRGSDVVCEQSIAAGEVVARGSVITLRAITTKFED